MPAGLAACSSYDPGSPVSPIAVAQHTLVELAGREAREFSLEIDRARTLLVRQMRSAEVHQLIHQIGVGLNVGHDLDHSLYFFAKILIRNAEYCRIRDLGMSDEITMNSDELSGSGVASEAIIVNAILSVRLTDDETGGLFGFRFD